MGDIRISMNELEHRMLKIEAARNDLSLKAFVEFQIKKIAKEIGEKENGKQKEVKK